MDFDAIRVLLKKNEIAKAIKALEIIVENKDKMATLEHISGQWASLKEKVLKGIISNEDSTIAENKIRSHLFEFMSNYEKGNSEITIPINKKGNFDRIIIVSFLILISSFLAYQYFQKVQLAKENLSIIIDRRHGNFKTEISDTTPNSIGCWYDITLINNSNEPISIVHYQPHPIGKRMVIGKGYGLFYKENHKHVDYPMELEPKKSIKFELKIGLNLSSKAYEVIKAKFTNLENLQFEEVVRAVNMNKMDLFGNKVIYEASPDGWYHSSIDQKNIHQTLYYLNFKSSSGQEFKAKLGYYQVQLMEENKDIRFYPQ